MAIQKNLASVDFVRPSYGPRLLTLGLGFVAIASVLFSLEAPWWVWLGPAVHGLIWPHFAWHRTRHAPNPITTENCNLLIDHFAGGMWMAAIAFNALPSALILALTGASSMAVGGPRQLFRGIAAHTAGVGAGLLAYGAHWQPVPSLYETLACLPLLVLYPLLMARVTHQAAYQFRHRQQELAYLPPLTQHEGARRR